MLLVLNMLRRLARAVPRSRSTVLGLLFFVVLAAIVAEGHLLRTARPTLPEVGSSTPRAYLPFTPNAPSGGPAAPTPDQGVLSSQPPAPTVASTPGSEPPLIPTVAPDVGSVPTILPSTPAVSVAGTPTPPPYRLYIPAVGSGSAPPVSVPIAATPTPEAASPTPAAPIVPNAPSAPQSSPTPTPTRRPIRITKLGLGVYDSGGAMLPDLDRSRPSVILLQDPSPDFAQEVRRRFPKAFIIGRVFTASQPVDNPAQRGHDFADRVAGVALPLKGVVDAWVSYNEVGSSSDPGTLANYCAFQVAFAQHLQNDYGIAAVAGNDGPRAVTAQDYARYCAAAIQTSKYFGFHDYTNPDITSLRDPRAADQVFSYRAIHSALAAAGVSSGPFVATEAGLYNGWRGVTSDTSMAQDYTWLADQMAQDPYVLGECVYGLFLPGRWENFNVDGSDILQIMGDYNTVP